MASVRAIAAALFLLALPVLVVTTNVRVAATETRLWEWGFERHDVAATTGIDRAQLDRAAAEMAAYFTNDDPYLRTRVVVDGRIEPLFNPRETIHMADVKDMMQLVFFAQYVSLAYVLTYVVGVFVWAGEDSVRMLARRILGSTAVLAGVAIAAGGVALIGFDAFWQRFHVLGFSNDLWQLNPRTDRLIQMFPEDFFFEMALLVAAATLVQVAALAGAAWWYLRRAPGDAEAPAALPHLTPFGR